MAKNYVCKACNKGSRSDATHRCDHTCSECMASPTCAFSAVRIPCAECNRHFRSQARFANKHSTSNKKAICESKRCGATCGALKRSNKNECNKRYCDTCKQNREVRHLCYMRTLKDVFLVNADKVQNVFYKSEITQNKRYSDTAKARVPNLVCVQETCARCKDVEGDRLRGIRKQVALLSGRSCRRAAYLSLRTPPLGQ